MRINRPLPPNGGTRAVNEKPVPTSVSALVQVHPTTNSKSTPPKCTTSSSQSESDCLETRPDQTTEKNWW